MTRSHRRPQAVGLRLSACDFPRYAIPAGRHPLLHLKPPNGMTDAEQRKELGLLKRLNEIWSADKQDDSELDARIRAYELAYKMQSAAPEVVDLSKESDATKKLYGMDEEETRPYGQNCLLARRLVERGVTLRGVILRFRQRLGRPRKRRNQPYQVVQGFGQPIAGLLTDLKARGLLKDTLVVWGGEFGRTPFNERGLGPRPHPWASRFGWQAAARRAGSMSARPTNLVCTPRSAVRM